MTKPGAEITMELDPHETVRLAQTMPSWGHVAVVFVLGLLMVPGGVWMVADGEGFKGWLVSVFGVFMLGIVALVMRKRLNANLLEETTVSPDGLAFKIATAGRFIPWSEVTGMRLSNVMGTRMLGIGLSDAARVMVVRSAAMTAIGKRSERFTGPGDIAITSHVVPLPTDALYAMLLTYISTHTDSLWARSALEKIEARSV